MVNVYHNTTTLTALQFRTDHTLLKSSLSPLKDGAFPCHSLSLPTN